MKRLLSIALLLSSISAYAMLDKKSLQTFHTAVGWNDIKSVSKTLIKYPLAGCLQDERGDTALHIAIQKRRSDMVDLMVKSNGSILEVKNKSGSTPLMTAVIWKNRRGVEQLLKYGANVSTPDVYGRTPLHYAAWLGYTDIAKMLLKGGADNEVLTALNIVREKHVLDSDIRRLFERLQEPALESEISQEATPASSTSVVWRDHSIVYYSQRALSLRCFSSAASEHDETE